MRISIQTHPYLGEKNSLDLGVDFSKIKIWDMNGFECVDIHSTLTFELVSLVILL